MKPRITLLLLIALILCTNDNFTSASIFGEVVREAQKKLAEEAKKKAGATAGNAKDTVKKVADKVVDKVQDKVPEAVDKVMDAAKSAASSGMDAAKGAAYAIKTELELERAAFLKKIIPEIKTVREATKPEDLKKRCFELKYCKVSYGDFCRQIKERMEAKYKDFFVHLTEYKT